MNKNTTDADLAYQLNGETRYYKNVWEKIEDEHYPECPTSIQAGKRLSTRFSLCLCDKIQVAVDAAQASEEHDREKHGNAIAGCPDCDAARAEECLRCHQFVNGCKCGAKAQWI